MPDSFKSIKETFNSEPGLSKIRQVIQGGNIVAEFEKIFPDLKQIAEAKSVEKNTLTLKVENAAWRNELKFRENDIIKKINSFYKEGRIDKIKFSAK